MKVLVSGSRDFKNATAVFDFLNLFHCKHNITWILEGGARGVDKFAWSWAVQRGIKWTEYRADWKTYGTSAGPRRNQEMLDQKPEALIAFFTDPENPSFGTRDCVSRARKMGIPVYLGHEELE